ncbi:MAG: Clp protease N-terminal domain-containing protein [Mycobacteriales bacterium]
MLEHFTPEAREAVYGAREEAKRLHHPTVESAHLLLALLDTGTGVAHAVLREAGLDHETARAEVRRLAGTPEKILDEGDAEALRSVGIDLAAVQAMLEEHFGSDALDPDPPERQRRALGRRQQATTRGRFTPAARKVLALAVREARHLGAQQIGTEHLLLGLIRDGRGAAATVLTSTGASLDELRAATLAKVGRAA